MTIHIFLDRDGTLIKDTGYISEPSKVLILSGVVEGLRLLKSREFDLHIVSNQSGVARGKISMDQFRVVETKVKNVFLAKGLEFDSVNYCFHLPEDNCSCRKPAAGLIEKVGEKYKIQKSECAMIGNSIVDEGAARNFGIPFWYVTEQEDAFYKIAREVVNHFDDIKVRIK
jgi:histidinol-phosphate phosphatase family protein